MKAPERIWINPTTDLPKLSGVMDKDSVQYIQADAFIEKACEFMRNHIDPLSEYERKKEKKIMTRQEYNREVFSHETCEFKWNVLTQKNQELCWLRLCNIATENGKSHHNEEFITLSKDKRFIEWLPKDSETMYCINIEDLKKLPKEEELWQQ